MKQIISICTLLLLILTGCNDEFLNRPPLDQITDENYWQTEQHIIDAANACYSGMIGKDMLNMIESMGESSPWAVSFAWRNVGGGNYNSDLSQINSRWSVGYKTIRRCNYLLENYNRATTVSAEKRERYAAEAIFHRAWQYWLLTSFFGDVPYVTRTLTTSSPELYMGRTPRELVVDSIINDLENYYKKLPAYIAPASNEFGRITQAAALTLISRIALYNGRWDKAADAAERCMNLNYYQLYTTGDVSNDYTNLFNFKGRASRNATNKEVILAYIYNFDLGETARSSHSLSREMWVPNDYARFIPTISMMNAYLCSDGLPIDKSPLYQENTYEDIFQNRDPRLQQSIVAPGSYWNGGSTSAESKLFLEPKMINDKVGCMTYSGFYVRKYVEPSKVGTVGQDDNDIIIFRYAEVLLNYAEAMYRLNRFDQDVADRTINLLRNRVGMHNMVLSELTANGMSIEEEIKRERRVELFMEGHRWFDITRWREGYRLGQDLLGVKKSWLNPENCPPTLIFNPQGYLVIETNRKFNDPQHYLLPIPYTQIERNPNLKPNNPGW